MPFEVPGVSPATAVPAYAGIPLVSDTTGDVRVIHASEASRVQATDGTLVIMGAESGPVDLGKMLIAAGWAETAPFAITWNGTTTSQHTVLGTLGSIAADLKAAGVSLLTMDGPAVAVVGDGVTAQTALSWFETGAGVQVLATDLVGRHRIDGRGGCGQWLAGPGSGDHGNADGDQPGRRGHHPHLLGRRNRRRLS